MGRLQDLLEGTDLDDQLARARQAALPEWPFDQVQLLTPVETQEIWAAGVTYLRSKQARMEESDFSARAYDHVYEAARPEIYAGSCAMGPWVVVGMRVSARCDAADRRRHRPA